MKLHTYDVEFKVVASVSAADLDDAHGEADQVAGKIREIYGVKSVKLSKVEFSTNEEED